MMAELTPKQSRFVTEYLATGNASEAYRRAYDCKRMKSETVHRSAHAVLSNPKVAARLSVVEEKTLETQVLTREWVLRRLMLNAQMALGEAEIQQSVTTKGETQSQTVRKVDHAAANKALELLGKVDGLGLFVDRSSVDVRQEFAQMDDNELDEFINERLN